MKSPERGAIHVTHLTPHKDDPQGGPINHLKAINDAISTLRDDGHEDLASQLAQTHADLWRSVTELRELADDLDVAERVSSDPDVDTTIECAQYHLGVVRYLIDPNRQEDQHGTSGT